MGYNTVADIVGLSSFV